MRFSTLTAFMLPLATLAAPTLVQHDSNLNGPLGDLQDGLHRTIKSLNEALDLVKVNKLDVKNTVQNLIKGTIDMIDLEPQLGNLNAGVNGQQRENVYVDTPPQSKSLTGRLFLQPT